MPKLVVAMTGGIGSGKTTVSEIFASLGIPVIDADRIVSDLLASLPIRQLIRRHLGRGCLDRQGLINRGFLRQTIMADPSRRKRLEGILHPRVWQSIENGIKKSDAPYCLVVVPLLFETGQQHRFDRTLIIDAPDYLRIRRLRHRPGWNLQHIRTMLSLQVSRRLRLSLAQDRIENHGTRKQLQDQVEKLDRFYRQLAAAKDAQDPFVVSSRAS